MGTDEEGRVGGGARLGDRQRWRRARGFQGVEVEQMALGTSGETGRSCQAGEFGHNPVVSKSHRWLLQV